MTQYDKIVEIERNLFLYLMDIAPTELIRDWLKIKMNEEEQRAKKNHPKKAKKE